MEYDKKPLSSPEPTAQWGAKNSVFIDLFNIPEYRLQLYKALHPEDTKTTEKDIELITLNPVLLNMMYNDLGMLVKDRLLIFVEAQSTWSINILLRILMYTANTYHDYITERQMNVYGRKKLRVPSPEFYVIYTGDKKLDKDVLSLREDFFCDPKAQLDLYVKVIHTENKDDIIGQYIIFAHVYDEQIKIHGRNRIAAENAIRICQDNGILKEYLKSRQKEVITMMITLFDQDYVLKAYIKDEKRESEIKGLIEAYQELGASCEEAASRIEKKYNLDKEEAEEYLEEYWQK